jgi:uncharacterized protein YwqG
MDYLHAKSGKFIQTMLKYKRPTRELILSEGDVGAMPRTKISGVPWWPKSIVRPKCNRGHDMSFIAQIFLPDVPSLEKYQDALLSFHYCNLCSQEGNMAWGWSDRAHAGYNITLFKAVSRKEPDNIGIVQEPLAVSYNTNLRDIAEVPSSYEDVGLTFKDVPKEFPQAKNDFDENVYPNLIHISRSKLGGWPTWVQSPEWPNSKGNIIFVCQLDWWVFDKAPWASGGYSYLFLNEDNGKLSGELCIQVT